MLWSGNSLLLWLIIASDIANLCMEYIMSLDQWPSGKMDAQILLQRTHEIVYFSCLICSGQRLCCWWLEPDVGSVIFTWWRGVVLTSTQGVFEMNYDMLEWFSNALSSWKWFSNKPVKKLRGDKTYFFNSTDLIILWWTLLNTSQGVHVSKVTVVNPFSYGMIAWSYNFVLIN